MIEKKIKNTPKEVLLLEDPEHQENLKILNSITPDNEIQRELKNYEESILIEKKRLSLITKYPEQDIFTLSEILNDCEKYCLTFTKASNFHGKIDLTIIQKLKEICKSNNLIVSNEDFRSFTYVLGPQPITKNIKNSLDIDSSFKNPMIFFKIPNEMLNGENLYIKVTDNKKLYNPLSILKAFFSNSYIGRFSVTSIIIVPLVALLLTCIFPFSMEKTSEWYFFVYFFSIIITALLINNNIFTNYNNYDFTSRTFLLHRKFQDENVKWKSSFIFNVISPIVLLFISNWFFLNLVLNFNLWLTGPQLIDKKIDCLKLNKEQTLQLGFEVKDEKQYHIHKYQSYTYESSLLFYTKTKNDKPAYYKIIK